MKNAFTPITVTLKNQKQVTLRCAKIQDAEKLLKTVKTYIADSAYIPKKVSEITITISQEADWINSFVQKENSLLLVAEYQGELIGNIDLTGHTRMYMQHTAVIGMGMLREWREVGLGTALMQQAIAWAKENPVLELLWLQVYTENVAGIQLYKKMNFTEQGLLKKYFKHNGTYYDNLTMSLMV